MILILVNLILLFWQNNPLLFFLVKDYKIQASNDNNNWIDLTEQLVHPKDNTISNINITKNKDYYSSYRVYVYNTYDAYAVAINTLQFYGREQS